jgi:hypothetical protein
MYQIIQYQSVCKNLPLFKTLQGCIFSIKYSGIFWEKEGKIEGVATTR